MRIEYDPYVHTDCSFFMKIGSEEIKIATLYSQLVGIDKMFLDMHFPSRECSHTVLDLKYHTYSEVLEKAKRIVQTKMYKYAQDILAGITTVEQSEEKK